MKREHLWFIYIMLALTFLPGYHGISVVDSLIDHNPDWGSIICVAILLPTIYLHWTDRPDDF